MNSLYQQLNPTRQLPTNIKQMISSIKNPQAMLNQLAQQNPQLQSVIQASNGNYEQAFNNLAKQMNVNPDDVLNLLR